MTFDNKTGLQSEVSGRAKVGASISRHHNHTLAECDNHNSGGV
jgi:hypothetical protein